MILTFFKQDIYKHFIRKKYYEIQIKRDDPLIVKEELPPQQIPVKGERLDCRFTLKDLSSFLFYHLIQNHDAFIFKKRNNYGYI
jgi:hypothetical protein